jgi:O-succinylbenzoate synthase
MLPSLTDILDTARVVSIPMRQRFRGIETREVALFEGPEGWTEFSPFVEYGDTEASAWLAAAIDFGWAATPPLERTSVTVNATLPAVGADRVADVLDRFAGCRTVKVKVAEAGQTLADDVARVAAARAYLGAEGRIRIDANGGWNVDEAEHAIHALAEYDLEYVEQPCASVEELWQIRQRVKYMGLPIAADESVRKAEDPLEVARQAAADILVIKVQPLGGIHAALGIAAEAGLPVVVSSAGAAAGSSALETSVGISMGLHLAAALPELDFDCGLGTVSLLSLDVAEDPLIPVGGRIDVRRVVPNERVFVDYAASPERTAWWRERIGRCHALLAQRVE